MSSVANIPPSLPEKLAKKNVRFFNVSLRNGIVVSTPSYPEKQAFVAHLIRAIETANPDFAWIQFLFVSSSYGADLVRLKNSIHRTKLAIEQPSIDLISGEERDRKQLYRDYYRRADSRMKKVDEIITKPMITMAIQGMWVSDEPDSVHALPFDHCADEHDSLAVFGYRDPRMLLELVNRRMVEDISKYLDGYTKSRLEPPSFIVTPEELKLYTHLPTGERTESLRSVIWGTPTRAFTPGRIDVGAENREDNGAPARLVRLAKIPKYEKILEDVSVQPLDHLASASVRTFEIIYLNGKSDIMLSAETPGDMRKYVNLLNSVYGDLKCENAEPLPAFLRQLPLIVGLKMPHAIPS
jgi:hypothetical protein